MYMHSLHWSGWSLSCLCVPCRRTWFPVTEKQTPRTIFAYIRASLSLRLPPFWHEAFAYACLQQRFVKNSSKSLFIAVSVSFCFLLMTSRRAILVFVSEFVARFDGMMFDAMNELPPNGLMRVLVLLWPTHHATTLQRYIWPESGLGSCFECYEWSSSSRHLSGAVDGTGHGEAVVALMARSGFLPSVSPLSANQHCRVRGHLPPTCA